MLLLDIVWPAPLIKSETVTFTFVRPLPGACTPIWNDSYSPFPAYSSAKVPVPAGSDGLTRCRLGMTHTIGPLCALAIPANRIANKTYKARFDLKTRLVINILEVSSPRYEFRSGCHPSQSQKLGRQDLNAGGLILSATGFR